MKNGVSKKKYMDDKMDIALFGTMISMSIFTKLFLQSFEKHSMLESTLEILQQFYSNGDRTR
jgi:hypothetical protein